VSETANHWIVHNQLV